MTTILAVQTPQGAYLGADSQITDGDKRILSPSTPKIVKINRYLLGVSGDCRPGDVLMYNWKPPAYDGTDPVKFMGRKIIPSILAAFKAQGYDHTKESASYSYLLAFAGNVFEIGEDLSMSQSFDGIYGSIACAAWAFDDAPVQSSEATDPEIDVLHKLYCAVEDYMSVHYHGGSTSKVLTVVGHNIAGFDLPFLKHRSIILNMEPPASIMAAMKAKPWDSCVGDTMLMWSADREKRVSMDKLCRAFGIDGKGNFDGSMVASTWPVDPQKVIDYCKDDVIRTRLIYKRLTFSV